MLQSCFNIAAKLPMGELEVSSSKSGFLSCPPPLPPHPTGGRSLSLVQYVGLDHAVAQAELQVQCQGSKCGFLTDKVTM